MLWPEGAWERAWARVAKRYYPRHYPPTHPWAYHSPPDIYPSVGEHSQLWGYEQNASSSQHRQDIHVHYHAQPPACSPSERRPNPAKTGQPRRWKGIEE